MSSTEGIPPDHLDELEGILAEATPGPWYVWEEPCDGADAAKAELAKLVDGTGGPFTTFVSLNSPSNLAPAVTGCGPASKRNALAIASLFNLAPQLIAMARESSELKATNEVYRAKLMLHPWGACTCAGEGECPWCRVTAAQEKIEELEAAARGRRPKIGQTVALAHQPGCLTIVGADGMACSCGAADRERALYVQPGELSAAFAELAKQEPPLETFKLNDGIMRELSEADTETAKLRARVAKLEAELLEPAVGDFSEVTFRRFDEDGSPDYDDEPLGAGWYWTFDENDRETPWHGPHETREAAADDAWEQGGLERTSAP